MELFMEKEEKAEKEEKKNSLDGAGNLVPNPREIIRKHYQEMQKKSMATRLKNDPLTFHKMVARREELRGRRGKPVRSKKFGSETGAVLE